MVGEIACVTYVMVACCLITRDLFVGFICSIVAVRVGCLLLSDVVVLVVLCCVFAGVG